MTQKPEQQQTESNIVAELNGVSIEDTGTGAYVLSYQEDGRAYQSVYFDWNAAEANFERRSQGITM